MPPLVLVVDPVCRSLQVQVLSSQSTGRQALSRKAKFSHAGLDGEVGTMWMLLLDG
jgi:hypothetical protein